MRCATMDSSASPPPPLPPPWIRSFFPQARADPFGGLAADMTVGCAETNPLGRTSGDRIAERLLAGPLTILLGLVCLMQLITWIPHYLTWPLWADHDVFATLARGWEAG